MKRIVLGMFLLTCVVQSVHADDDAIKTTIRNRAVRKARSKLAARARAIKGEKALADQAMQAELVRQRVMENQRHAAQMQHAINGANANALQAQSNQIQAQRNAVLAEQNRAIQRAAGIAVCSNCGATGHYSCGTVQKSQAVLEHEAMLRGMLPY